jgi:hypothetical protein
MIIRTVFLIVLFAAPLFSQSAENVLLVLNETSSISMDVGILSRTSFGSKPALMIAFPEVILSGKSSNPFIYG